MVGSMLNLNGSRIKHEGGVTSRGGGRGVNKKILLQLMERENEKNSLLSVMSTQKETLNYVHARKGETTQTSS